MVASETAAVHRLVGKVEGLARAVAPLVPVVAGAWAES